MLRWSLPVVLICAVAGGLLLPSLRYRSIVVHHTASERDDLGSLRAAHRARGWPEAAYHLVLSNGSAGVPLGHLEPTFRFRFGTWSVATRSRWANLTGIHLAVVGNFEERPVPESLRIALGSAVRRLQERYRIPDDRVRLHRDCSSTACPGRFLDREALLGWGDTPPAPGIAAQQLRVLERSWSTPIAGAGGLLVFVAVARRRRRRAALDRMAAPE